MDLQNKNVRIAFIHGRPKGHPIHAMYANSIKADFYHEDIFLRWHDKPSTWKLKRYSSWILNAFLFPKRRKYDIFLTECIRIPQLIMKKVGLINKNQKLVALMADESLFFLYSNKYPKLTSLLMRIFLQSCDAIICIGEFQTTLAKKVLPLNHHKKIHSIFNGIEIKPFQTPINKEENTIVFIGSAIAEWRVWYKGLDLMIKSFAEAFQVNRLLQFNIIGNVKSTKIKNILKGLDNSTQKAINFIGEVKDVEPYLKKSSLYLHCSRGDAYPTSILEAMNLGVPPLISDRTGTQELVSRISKKLVVELDQNLIAKRINWFFDLHEAQKKELSAISKDIISDYDQSVAITNFRKVFKESISS